MDLLSRTLTAPEPRVKLWGALPCSLGREMWGTGAVGALQDSGGFPMEFLHIRPAQPSQQPEQLGKNKSSTNYIRWKV